LNLFEQILQFKGYTFSEAKKELARLQAMSVDQFLDCQQKKAWQQVRFHYEHNPLYRKLVGNTLPGKWEDLPIVTKKDLQQPLSNIITKGVNLKDCHTGNTSGSTGTPFFYAKDKMTHAMTWAVIADRYGWYGLTFSSRQARFYGIPKEFVANSKERLKDKMMNRERFCVFDLSDKAMEQFIQRFRNRKFDYVYGYTSALVMFARYLIDKGITIKEVCPSLKICISTSETATPEDHKILEQGFGIPHIREYGLSETCITAFDAPDGNWRLTEETLFTETLNGKILSTSLYNTTLPMIRYETGDIGIIEKERVGIYRILRQLHGRTNDMIILPSGKTAAGLTFYYISRSVLETSGILKEFIIRQTGLNEFTFDIVSDRDLTTEEKELVKQKISLYLEPGLDIILNRVQHIERPASGKLKHFYSELNRH